MADSIRKFTEIKRKLLPTANGLLPTLLRGKLVDHYVDLDTATKADLQLLKTALMGENRSCTGSINSREVVHGALSTIW